MVIYRGNPGVEVERAAAIDGGDGANVSRLTMGVHTGTHIDGSLHFYDDGDGVDALPLEAMLGPCLRRRARRPRRGDRPRRRSRPRRSPTGAERVLLKTPNSRLWDRDEFTHDFVRLDGSGAECVLDRGIRLIGIDYLSIGDHDAHLALLGNGVVALEGLDLRGIEPGAYELICLPMRLLDTDGAPARVLLRDGDDEERESMTPIRRSAKRGGIDLGGTKIQAIVVDADNAVIGESRRPTPHDGGPAGRRRRDGGALREAAEAAGVEPSSLRGVGVGSPGEVDAATGAVSNAKNLPAWTDSFPLGATLARGSSGRGSRSATTSVSPPTPSTSSVPGAATTRSSASSGGPASAAG